MFLMLGERVINLQVANLNIGILYVFAMGSLGVYGIVIGAWASNNKFSLLGGVRGSAQMISYEVAMGLSVIGILMVFGTLELQEIARGQGTLIRDLLPGVGAVSQIRGRLAARLGHFSAAAGLSAFFHCRGGGDQTDPVRLAGRRVGTGRRLSRRIFRRQVFDVLCR